MQVLMSREAAKEVLASTQFVAWENEDFQEGVAALNKAIEADKKGDKMPAQVHQVALVNITKHGSDVGLFVNGSYVISADPGCGDDVQSVKATAYAICAELETPITEMDFEPDDEWQWGDIHLLLIDQGKLIKPCKPR